MLRLFIHQEIVSWHKNSHVIMPKHHQFYDKTINRRRRRKNKNLIIFLHSFSSSSPSNLVFCTYYKLVSIIYRSLSRFDLKEGRPWGKQIYGHKFSPLRKGGLYFILQNKSKIASPNASWTAFKIEK